MSTASREDGAGFGAPPAPTAATVASALKAGRLHLVYQPITSLNGQPTPYYEAFARLRDATGAEILPQEFLPLVHRAGLAVTLDAQVIGRALAVLDRQRALHHEPTLFLKLTRTTALDRRLLPWLERRLREHRLPAQRLVLQLTLETALAEPAAVAELCAALTRLGCGLALEHYDPEADRLRLLDSLPLNFLKPAPALTEHIIDQPARQGALQQLTAHCRQHRIRTVATTVQDAVSLAGLWRCGVDYSQGYFMQEPCDLFPTEAAVEPVHASGPDQG